MAESGTPPISNVPAPPHGPGRDTLPAAKPETAPDGTAFPDLTGIRIIQELARSPKGIVYKARRLIEQDVVAVKVFRPEAVRDADFRARLEQDAEASFLLEHPHLVRSLGCLDDSGRFIMVMELAPGESLARALQRSVRFLPPRALAIIRQCAEGLQYASARGRYHGRLHPGDVILGESGARLLGVGWGERPDSPHTRAGSGYLFEPLIYVAPERQPLPRKAAAGTGGDVAADLFSLGAVLYQMLTGMAPYHGADAVALAQERNALAPAVARWPQGTETLLPPRSVALVQRLLASNPAVRGTYAQLLQDLDAALKEVGGQPEAVSRPAVASSLLAPAEVPARAPVPAPSASAGTAGAGAPSGALASAPAGAGATVAVNTAAAAPQAAPGAPTRVVRAPVWLIVAVVSVFAFTLGLAVKTWLWPGAFVRSAPPVPGAPVAANGKGGESAGTPLPGPGQNASRESDADEASLAQLNLIQDMLRTGEAQPNLVTARLLREIADKAGTNSRARARALLMLAEVEGRLRSGADGGGSRPPAPASEADAKAFQELLNRARERAALHHFSEAMELLRQLPAALKAAPYSDQAARELTLLEQQAKAAFAELTIAAEKAVAEKDFGTARRLYQSAQTQFGVPALVQAATERDKAVAALEHAAAQSEAAARAQRDQARELGALAEAVRSAAALASLSRHAEAKAGLDAFIKTLQDPLVAQLAAGFLKLSQDEFWLFERSRKSLKDQIARLGSSPLQVTEVRGGPSLELLDFGPEGLIYGTTRGPSSGKVTKEWNTVPPREVVKLLQFFCDKANAQEQLALAVVAWQRALKAHAEARQLALDSQNKAADEQKAAAAELLKDAEAAWDEAARADPAGRERQADQRVLLTRLAELVEHPPAAAPGP